MQQGWIYLILAITLLVNMVKMMLIINYVIRLGRLRYHNPSLPTPFPFLFHRKVVEWKVINSWEKRYICLKRSLISCQSPFLYLYPPTLYPLQFSPCFSHLLQINPILFFLPSQPFSSYIAHSNSFQPPSYPLPIPFLPTYYHFWTPLLYQLYFFHLVITICMYN